jgi:tRNA U55 pseudouridine synthase TruB
LKEFGDSKCIIARFEASVTSGIYIRTLATMFGVNSLAYSIKRTKVGEYEM